MELAACLWSEGVEPRAAVGGDGGGDGRPGEGEAEGGCGGSMGGDVGVAALHRGMQADDTYMTLHH